LIWSTTKGGLKDSLLEMLNDVGEKYCNFPYKTLWIATIFFHIVFFLHMFICYDFFKLFLSIYFFNIEMAENLVLYFFSFILSFYEVSIVCKFIEVTQVAPIYEKLSYIFIDHQDCIWTYKINRFKSSWLLDNLIKNLS